MTWMRHNELIWGMPGSRWEHHDGPFQVPKHFRMVYRLHELILSDHEVYEPGTDRLIERVDLISFINLNTRTVVEKFGYEALAQCLVVREEVCRRSQAAQLSASVDPVPQSARRYSDRLG